MPAIMGVDGVEVGWAYLEPFDFARDLAGLHAFWADRVRVEQDPDWDDAGPGVE